MKVDTLQAVVKANAFLSHSESDSVEFVITKTQSVPFAWTASICVNGNCYAPFVNQVPEEYSKFAAGRTDTVAIWFQGFVKGTGFATINVAPADEPENAVAITFSLITEEADVLIVDDDGGAAYDSLCAASLPESLVAGTWKRSLDSPTAAELARFSRVIWLTGEASPTLDAVDRAAISGYLAGGGEMMLSGQNIAYELCDPKSPEFSEEARDWLRDTFHVTYGSDNAGAMVVSGVEGDPIADALSFAIEGGTGASNQTSPDVVAAAENGVPCFTYAGSGVATRDESPAGVRNATHCPTTVFLGFGFEGIAEAADRDALLARVLDYMDSSTPNPDSCRTTVAPPPSNEMLSLSRNPFSPAGDGPLEFVIRVAPPSPARLEIFDASGRAVRTLLDGQVTQPQTSVPWDGTDNDNERVPSGVYFARLTAGSETATQRTVLLK